MKQLKVLCLFDYVARTGFGTVSKNIVKEIKTNPNEAVQEVKWLKNNKTLLYSQSYKGYYNWFIIDADGTSKEKQLTKVTKNNRQITLNSDVSKGVYLSGRNDICLLDLTTFKNEIIVSDELWAFNNSNPYFSPDDKYIIYNAFRDFETDVFTYNLASKKIENLTNTKVSESEPIWSPDGKYVYFSSDKLLTSKTVSSIISLLSAGVTNSGIFSPS